MNQQKAKERLISRKYKELLNLKQKLEEVGRNSDKDYIAKIYDLEKEIFRLIGPDFSDGVIDMRIFCTKTKNNNIRELRMSVYEKDEIEKIGEVLVKINAETGNIDVDYSFEDGTDKVYPIRALQIIRENIAQNNSKLTFTVYCEDGKKIQTLKEFGAERNLEDIAPYAVYSLSK